jgi:GTP-binding protein EngB required for normal cell division
MTSAVSPSRPLVAGLGRRHRSVLASTLSYLEELLGKVGTIADGAASRSPFSAYQMDLSPAQQTVVADLLADVRARMADAIEWLALTPPERTVASWAIHVTLERADIALAEVRASRLRGYGELDPDAALAVEEYLADLARRLRRLQVYLARGPEADLGGRLARLERTPVDLEAVRLVERIITRRGLVELRPTLESLVERLERGTLELAVFGRVSSGKSSLLNAILGTDVLPVGVTPVTAVPTRIVAGAEPEATVRFADAPSARIPVTQLAEFVAEDGNPGNRRHVTAVTVRVPSPALREGVVLVDTPGLGSLATGGERESYAYLPRCDLGILLVDPVTGPTPHDVDVLRLLHDSAIPGMVVLSKVDLLSDDERRRVREHVRLEVARYLGLEVAVHLVSVAGDARLARDWFARAVAPLGERVRELSAASARRKLGYLLEAVHATLRATRRARGGDDGAAAERRHRVEALAAQAEAELLEARGRVDALAEGVRDGVPRVIADVAAAVARGDAGRTLAAALTEAAEDAAGAAQQAIVAARDRLQALAARIAAEAAPARREPVEALAVSLLGRPVFDACRILDEPALPRPPRSRRFAGLVERRVRRLLQEALAVPATDAVARFACELRRWGEAALRRLAEEFAAQTEPERASLRRQADRDAEPADDASVEADIAALARFLAPSCDEATG